MIWNFKRAIIFALCLIGTWSANAQLTVCNKYSTPLTLMITYRSDSNAWINKGWFRFTPNECAQVQTPLRGPYFYYYAKAENGAEWTDSKDPRARCVSSKPFDTDSCDGTDRSVNVKKVEFSGDQFTLNLAAASTPPAASPPPPPPLPLPSPSATTTTTPTPPVSTAPDSESSIDFALSMILESSIYEDKYVPGSVRISQRGRSADGLAPIVVGTYMFYNSYSKSNSKAEFFARIENGRITCVRMSRGIFELAPCEEVSVDSKAARNLKLVKQKIRVEEDRQRYISALSKQITAINCEISGRPGGGSCTGREFRDLHRDAISLLEKVTDSDFVSEEVKANARKSIVDSQSSLRKRGL